jgi:hypothetical protein
MKSGRLPVLGAAMACLLLGSCGDDKDLIRPAEIVDLTAVPLTASTIRLTWTATGDDGSDGTADLYDIRHSPGAGGTDWDAAEPVGSIPVPLPAGEPETLIVGGLDRSTTYSFAIRAIDDAGLGSEWSNAASSVTPFEPLPFAADEHTVALYHFEDFVLEETLDSSPYANDALVSGPRYVGGRFGAGLRFDGVNDFIRISRSASLDPLPLPEMTIEAWVRLDSPERQALFSKALRYPSVCWPWFVLYRDEELFGVVRGCIGGVAGGTLTVGAWHYVAFVYDDSEGQREARLYVDGVLSAAADDLETETADLDADLYLGAAYYYFNAGNGLQDFFAGTMDEVRISSIAREINGLP